MKKRGVADDRRGRRQKGKIIAAGSKLLKIPKDERFGVSLFARAQRLIG
jgi:hypothetical protein